MKQDSSASAKAWDLIENEKRRDRLIRKIAIIAWSVTLAIVLAFTALTGVQVAGMVKAARLGAVPWSSAIGTATPLIVTLGKLSLLIATMATVAIFLRLRTSSLSEIQLRLAALEDMLASRPDVNGATRP